MPMMATPATKNGGEPSQVSGLTEAQHRQRDEHGEREPGPHRHV